MSNTPRTDAARAATLTPEYEYEGAESEAWAFAETLERELAKSKHLLKELMSECEHEFGGWGDTSILAEDEPDHIAVQVEKFLHAKS